MIKDNKCVETCPSCKKEFSLQRRYYSDDGNKTETCPNCGDEVAIRDGAWKESFIVAVSQMVREREDENS